VNHDFLLYKLEARFGITYSFLCVIQDFLRNRKQRVVVDGTASEWCHVLSGVAQGSIMGPPLFVLYIIYISLYILIYNDIDVSLFADDTKLVKNVRDAIILQRALHATVHWCKLCRLQPNVNKCGVIILSRENISVNFDYIMSGSILQKLNNVDDLGVIFDTKLLFINHKTSVRSKAM
jgi:hypothetical protein